MASNRAQILIRAVDETRGAFDSVKRGLGGLADAARSVNGVLAGLGVAVSAAGLGTMVKSALESADALNKLSQRVGIRVEALSTLMPAAELSGVSAQAFETGLKKLATAMLEAATGSEESARRFAALGVAFQDQDGTLRATDAVLLDLADRFKAMPDGAQKSALAVQLFGKSGAELIPFLNQGRDGIAALTGEMQALGAATVGKAFVGLGEAIGAGVAAFVHIGVAQQLVVRHLAHLAQPVHGGLVQVSCLACGADQATQGAVQLGAVAGGQQGHLGTVGAMPWQPQMLVQILVQTLQRRGELIHRERKASAQAHGDGGVVQPQGQDAYSPRL